MGDQESNNKLGQEARLIEWQGVKFNAFPILKRQGIAARLRFAKQRIVSTIAGLPYCHEGFESLHMRPYELFMGRGAGLA